MPRPSQENKILEAALECFAEMGFEGTRIRHIADKAGVAESALYRHYASKEEIAQTLFQFCCGELITKLQAIVSSPLPVREKLEKLVRVAFDDYRSQPFSIAYVMTQPPGFDKDVFKNFVSPLKIIADVITEGQAEGIIRAGPPMLLTGMFISSFTKLFSFAHTSGFTGLDRNMILENEQVIVEAALSLLANSS